MVEAHRLKFSEAPGLQGKKILALPRPIIVSLPGDMVPCLAVNAICAQPLDLFAGVIQPQRLHERIPIADVGQPTHGRVVRALHQ